MVAWLAHVAQMGLRNVHRILTGIRERVRHNHRRKGNLKSIVEKKAEVANIIQLNCMVLLGCNAVYYGELPTFLKNIWSQSSPVTPKRR
jgi:hypothetical protein